MRITAENERKYVAVLLVGLLVALGLTVWATIADATPSEKVTICHATNSESNPYTSNNVNTSSVDEQNNRYLNGHGNHPNDIIPPFTSPEGTYFPGQNWDEEGQAIWNNGCKVPGPTTTEATTSTSTTSSTSSTTTSTTSVVPTTQTSTTSSTVPSTTTTTTESPSTTTTAPDVVPSTAPLPEQPSVVTSSTSSTKTSSTEGGVPVRTTG